MGAAGARRGLQARVDVLDRARWGVGAVEVEEVVGLRPIMVRTSCSLTPFSNTVWANTRRASDGIGLCRCPVSDTSRQRGRRPA